MSNKRTGRMPAAHPEKVRERSGGMCERCIVRPASEIHHRRFLSRGGKHNVANLLHLCGSGNIDGCHGEAHTGIGDAVGTSIKSFNPRHESKIAFSDLLGREWLIDDHGGKEEKHVERRATVYDVSERHASASEADTDLG